MPFIKQKAVRFIHSEIVTAAPEHQAIMPVGIGINAGDGSVFTSDEFGNTIRLTDAEDLNLEQYVGRGRPLEGDPSDSEDINSGNVGDLNSILNHLYLHTLAYTPPADDRRLGIITVDAGTPVSFKPAEAPKAGTNKVTMSYLNRQTQNVEELDFFYDLREDVQVIKDLRLRFRCLAGSGKFFQVNPDLIEDPSYVPSKYDFIPDDGGTWLLELVHDYGTNPKGYQDGHMVGFVRLEVMPYV